LIERADFIIDAAGKEGSLDGESDLRSQALG
jgi:hypothetical protein